MMKFMACALSAVTVSAACASDLSSNSDVLGVRLGMTQAEAAKILKPSAETIQPLKAQVGGFFYDFQDIGTLFDLKTDKGDKSEQAALNFMFPNAAVAPDKGAAIEAMFTPHDQLRVFSKLDDPNQHIVVISRTVKFAVRAHPLGSVFFNALIDKYGAPLSNGKDGAGGYRELVWVTGDIERADVRSRNDNHGQMDAWRRQRIEHCQQRGGWGCERVQSSEEISERDRQREEKRRASKATDQCVPLLKELARFEATMNGLVRPKVNPFDVNVDSYESRGVSACGIVMRVWAQVDERNDEVLQYTLDIADFGEAMEGMRAFKGRWEASIRDTQEARKQELMANKPRL